MMNKHNFDHKCPKCHSTTLMGHVKFSFCKGGCWDREEHYGSGTEHLHWSCACGYEWASLCADHEVTDARPYRYD